MSQVLLVCGLSVLVLSGPAGPEQRRASSPIQAGESKSIVPSSRQPPGVGAPKQPRGLPAPTDAQDGTRGRTRPAHRPGIDASRSGQAPKTLALVNVSARISRQQVRWILKLYDVLRKVLPANVSLIDDFDVRALLAGDRPDWSLEQAKSLLARAKVAYAMLKIRQSLVHLEAAREILLRRVAVDQAKGLLAQVWAYLVMCYNSLGQPDLARQQAANLALVSASGRPLPEVLWQRYRPTSGPRRTRRARRRRTTRRSQVVLFVPPGARVFVDFTRLEEPTGKQPASTRPGSHQRPAQARKPSGPKSQKNESAGQGPTEQRYSLALTRAAYLAVEAPGKQHFFRVIEPTTKEIHVLLTPAVVDRQAKMRLWMDSLRGRRPTKTELQAIAGKAKASLLLLVRDTPQGLSVSLLDPFLSTTALWSKVLPSGQKDSAPWPKVEPQDLAGLGKLLTPPKPRPGRAALARTARTAARQVAGKKNLPIHKPKKKPLWKKWYFWVALGAVAVAATVFAVTKDKQGDEVDVRVLRP